MRLVSRLKPLLWMSLWLLGLSLLLLSLGYSPASAFAALFEGAFGSVPGLMGTLRRACPLLLAGLGVACAFQAGLWNIGAEGQLVLGAIAAAWISLQAGYGLAGCLLGACLAGGFWAALAGQLKTRRQAPEVIVTILLNFLAMELLSYVVLGPLREASRAYPQTDRIPEALQLPALFSGYPLHSGVLLALLAAVVLQLFMYRTVAGLQIRAVGISPGAALHAGIDVAHRQRQAMFLSGALAGLAGAIELLGVTHRLYERFSPGYGYTAIAVALLARLRPLAVVPSAILFGALEAGASQMQRSAGVPSVFVTLLQGLILLALLTPNFLSSRKVRQT